MYMQQRLFAGVILLLVFSTGIRGQSDTSGLTAALQTTFERFDSATSSRQRADLAARFSMIAAKWDKEWITHYYVAYTKAILSSQEKDGGKADALLDEADKQRAVAVDILGHETDETHVLAALIANWRIAVNPMSRGMSFGQVFREHIAAAKTLNPSNPRIYYLQGMAWYSMPKFVGGGKDVALPYLSKADSLYGLEKTGNIRKPYWGRQNNERYLDDCRSGK